MSQEKARIVKSHDIRIDNDYVDWISEVKHRYRSSQVKAAVKVNAEKLLFNWQLGRDLVQKKAEERWGAGVVEQVSLDLKREFPNAEGFSTSNLWYMKKWYLFYTDQVSLQKLQCFVGKLQSYVNQTTLKLQRPVGEIIKQTIYEPTIEDGVEFPQLFALVPRPFEPEFAGKLNYYVNAVDELMKSNDDNPTIGLLVCSDMDSIDVQWSFKGISTPMGVATYNNIRIKDALPSQEQLADRVRLLQKELQETKRLMKK